MARSGADAESQADRKEAGRRRLAEALRANLGRRKARSRGRQAGDAAAVDAGRDLAGQDLAGDAGATGEGAAQSNETGD